jgi:pyruvate/2-oxoglutarate dehydrogenase complex dihydrolipoamide dehydrogenase (E3) component
MARDLDDSRPAAALEATGARLFRGEGTLDDLRTVTVGREQLNARRAVVIATGSTATVPPIPGLALGGFTHLAHYHSRVIAQRLRGIDVTADHTAVPRVTYTDPEVASVGLSEAAARGRGIDVVVVTADLSETARGYIHVLAASLEALAAKATFEHAAQS